ncbi:MAG: hypothetical protein WAX38_03335 [Minisyncoccia bacterium]
MESPIQSSFIPTKLPTMESPQSNYGGSDGFDVVMLLGIIALVIAGTLSAGVFLYQQFVTKDLADKKAQLEKARGAFAPSLVTKIMRLDERIRSANGVLGAHLAPSIFFKVLEQTTLKSVQFTNVNYTVKPEGDLHVEMKGKAASVNGIALQASIFSRHNAIKEPIFSDLDIGAQGVTFAVNLNLNPETVKFESLVAAALSAQNGGSEESLDDTSATQSSFTEEEAPQDVTGNLNRRPAGGVQQQTTPTPRPLPKPQTGKPASDGLFGNTSE